MRLPTVIIFLIGSPFFSALVAGSEFAWQQADRYVPPDFAGFFPDSSAGGKRLDDLLTGKAKRVSEDEYPEAVRQGLRRATTFRSQILDGLGQSFIWRSPSDKRPQNAFALEVMYHAVGSKYFRHDALYYGLQVARNKTDNILRALMEFGYDSRSRTIWGIKQYDDVEHVASRLLVLLDQHERLPPKTVLTTYDVYQGITGKAPPQPERFRNLGQFVIVVEDRDAKLDGSQSLETMRMPFAQAMQLGNRLVDFTRRTHLGKLHLVALVQGVTTRDRLAEQLKDHPRYRLFSTQLLQPNSVRRLPEFQRYLPHGKIFAPPSWQEQVAVARQDYAWNRSGNYTPPAFEQFFPDDVEGGLALDRLYAERKKSSLSDQEILATVRQGLRHTSVRPNLLLGWFYPRFTRWPQNPAAVEILYHALGADIRPTGNDSVLYCTLYFGLGRSAKSENILRAMYDVYLKADQSCQQRILWLISKDRDKQLFIQLMLETLDKHARLPSSQVTLAYDGYRQLTGKQPPDSQRFAETGRFVLLFLFEEEISSKEAIRLVRAGLSPGKHLLEIKTQPLQEEPGTHLLFALIQGIAERDRLIQAFQDRDHDHLEFIDALPLIAGWADDLDGEGFHDFRDYLE